MPEIAKLAAIAVIAALCAVMVRRQTAEIGLIIALAAGALILSSALGTFSSVQALMQRLANLAGLSPALLTPIFKTVGIGLLTHISASICRDAGEGSIAAFAEVAGTAAAIFVALPLVEAVLEMMMGLI